MPVEFVQRTKEGGNQALVDQTYAPWTDIEFDTTRSSGGSSITWPSSTRLRLTESGYYYISYFIASDTDTLGNVSDDTTMHVHLLMETSPSWTVPLESNGSHGNHSDFGRTGVFHAFVIYITVSGTLDIGLQYRVTQNFTWFTGTPKQKIGGLITLPGTSDPGGSAVSNFSILRIDPGGVIPVMHTGHLTGSITFFNTNWWDFSFWTTDINKNIPESSGVFTLPETGIYKIGYSLSLYDSGLTTLYPNRPLQGRVLVNGSTLLGSECSQCQHSGHGYTPTTHSFIAQLDAGDQVKFGFRSPSGVNSSVRLTSSSSFYRECVTGFYIFKAEAIGRQDFAVDLEDDIVNATPGQQSTLPSGWSRSHSWGGVNPAIMVSWYISSMRSPHGGHAQCITYNNERNRSTNSPSANDGRITTTTYDVAAGYSSYRIRGDVLLAGSASMLCQLRVLSTGLGALNTFTQSQLGTVSTNPTTWDTFDFAISSSVAGRSDIYVDFWVNTMTSDNDYEGVRFANVEIIGVMT